MREIGDDAMGEFEGGARESVKHLRAYFTYQGVATTTYRDKARAAVAMIGAYARLRSSETKRMAVEMASAKLLTAPPEQKRLT